MISSAPAAGSSTRDRQAFLAHMTKQVSSKTEELRSKMSAANETEETFQAWISELIFESLNQMSPQFTEAVIGRTQERIQRSKLDHVTELITITGEDEATRT